MMMQKVREGVKEDMMVAMLDTLQAAAAACSEVCVQRLRILHRDMLQAFEEAEAQRSCTSPDSGESSLPVLEVVRRRTTLSSLLKVSHTSDADPQQHVEQAGPSQKSNRVDEAELPDHVDELERAEHEVAEQQDEVKGAEQAVRAEQVELQSPARQALSPEGTPLAEQFTLGEHAEQTEEASNDGGGPDLEAMYEDWDAAIGSLPSMQPVAAPDTSPARGLDDVRASVKARRLSRQSLRSEVETGTASTGSGTARPRGSTAQVPSRLSLAGFDSNAAEASPGQGRETAAAVAPGIAQTAGAAEHAHSTEDVARQAADASSTVQEPSGVEETGGTPMEPLTVPGKGLSDESLSAARLAADLDAHAAEVPAAGLAEDQASDEQATVSEASAADAHASREAEVADAAGAADLGEAAENGAISEHAPLPTELQSTEVLPLAKVDLAAEAAGADTPASQQAENSTGVTPQADAVKPAVEALLAVEAVPVAGEGNNGAQACSRKLLSQRTSEMHFRAEDAVGEDASLNAIEEEFEVVMQRMGSRKSVALIGSTQAAGAVPSQAVTSAASSEPLPQAECGGSPSGNLSAAALAVEGPTHSPSPGLPGSGSWWARPSVQSWYKPLTSRAPGLPPCGQEAGLGGEAPLRPAVAPPRVEAQANASRGDDAQAAAMHSAAGGASLGEGEVHSAHAAAEAVDSAASTGATLVGAAAEQPPNIPEAATIGETADKATTLGTAVSVPSMAGATVEAAEAPSEGTLTPVEATDASQLLEPCNSAGSMELKEAHGDSIDATVAAPTLNTPAAEQPKQSEASRVEATDVTAEAATEAAQVPMRSEVSLTEAAAQVGDVGDVQAGEEMRIRPGGTVHPPTSAGSVPSAESDVAQGELGKPCTGVLATDAEGSPAAPVEEAGDAAGTEGEAPAEPGARHSSTLSAPALDPGDGELLQEPPAEAAGSARAPEGGAAPVGEEPGEVPGSTEAGAPTAASGREHRDTTAGATPVEEGSGEVVLEGNVAAASAESAGEGAGREGTGTSGVAEDQPPTALSLQPQEEEVDLLPVSEMPPAARLGLQVDAESPPELEVSGIAAASGAASTAPEPACDSTVALETPLAPPAEASTDVGKPPLDTQAGPPLAVDTGLHLAPVQLEAAPGDAFANLLGTLSTASPAASSELPEKLALVPADGSADLLLGVSSSPPAVAKPEEHTGEAATAAMPVEVPADDLPGVLPGLAPVAAGTEGSAMSTPATESVSQATATGDALADSSAVVLSTASAAAISEAFEEPAPAAVPTDQAAVPASASAGPPSGALDVALASTGPGPSEFPAEVLATGQPELLADAHADLLPGGSSTSPGETKLESPELHAAAAASADEAPLLANTPIVPLPSVPVAASAALTPEGHAELASAAPTVQVAAPAHAGADQVPDGPAMPAGGELVLGAALTNQVVSGVAPTEGSASVPELLLAPEGGEVLHAASSLTGAPSADPVIPPSSVDSNGTTALHEQLGSATVGLPPTVPQDPLGVASTVSAPGPASGLFDFGPDVAGEQPPLVSFSSTSTGTATLLLSDPLAVAGQEPSMAPPVKSLFDFD